MMASGSDLDWLFSFVNRVGMKNMNTRHVIGKLRYAKMPYCLIIYLRSLTLPISNKNFVNS